MRSSCLVILLLLLLGSGARAEDWTFFGGSKFADLFVDLASIERGDESSEVWVKYVFTPEGRARFLSNTKVEVSYSRELLEITRKKRHKSKNLILYNDAGSILYERKREKAWAPIGAEKHLEPLWKYLYQGHEFEAETKL